MALYFITFVYKYINNIGDGIVYKQEINALVLEWLDIKFHISTPKEGMPLTLMDYIKLRSQDGTVKFITDKDWKIIQEQRTKLSAVDVKLESIEEDFK